MNQSQETDYYSSNSTTPNDILYIESEVAVCPQSIPDLVKSRSRGAKNKAQFNLEAITKLESDLHATIRKARVGKSSKVKPRMKRSVIAPPKRAHVDAEITCLKRDAIYLRRHCEFLYNYFDRYHVDEDLPIAMYINRVFSTLLTFERFKIMIRLSTGILLVDFLGDERTIDVSCKCGKFHANANELKYTEPIEKASASVNHPKLEPVPAFVIETAPCTVKSEPVIVIKSEPMSVEPMSVV